MHCPELGFLLLWEDSQLTSWASSVGGHALSLSWGGTLSRPLLSADPSRSAFSAAVRRLEEDDSEIELFPGVQDLISGALQSRLAKHSRQSVVDDEVDVGTDRSQGRGPLR